MEQQQHGADAFKASRDEIGWFFAESDGALGFHAQSYTSGGGGEWDAARIMRAHLSRRSAWHRSEIERHARVHSTLVRLDVRLLEDLAAVYTPFGASRTTWQAYCVFTHVRQGRRPLPLLGLALRTGALRASFNRRHKESGEHVPAFHELLRWIEDEVADLDHAHVRPGHALPNGHRLGGALKEALVREETATGVYHELRAQRLEADQEKNRELLANLRRTSFAKWSARLDSRLARQKVLEEAERARAREEAILWGTA